MTADTAHDPKKTTTYRAMLAVVILLGVLIVLALGALIVGAVMKVNARHASAGCVSDCGTAQLPPGAKITSMQTTGNRLVIGFHEPDGDGVEIVDTDTGKLVAIMKPAPHGPPK